MFEANASIELADTVTVAKIQLVNGARVVLTGAGMWLKSSAFSGTGTLALDGTRLTGISTASSSWDVGLTLPSTFGIEILPNATESRITADGDKKHFQIDGPLTGAGTVRIGYSGSGLGGVKLCGDNSGFQGKLIIDHAATARNRFGAAQAGGEYMSLVYEGNTGDNGSVDFGDGVLKFGSLQTSDRRLANYPWRFNNSGTNILEVGHLGKSDDRISVRVGENNATTGHLKIRKVGTGTLELWNPGHRYGTEIDNGTILVTSDKALNLYADGDITFGHDVSAPGGILKYGVNQWADDGSEFETPVDVTTDYSALIKNSFAPVAIDTDGKDVTFATALSDSNVGGISKYGEGTLTLSAFQTLLSPVAVSNGTLYAYVNANVTGRIDIAENATLTLYGQSKNIDSASVCGAGTIRFVQEAGKARSFRLGQNADFSGFAGKLYKLDLLPCRVRRCFSAVGIILIGITGIGRLCPDTLARFGKVGFLCSFIRIILGFRHLVINDVAVPVIDRHILEYQSLVICRNSRVGIGFGKIHGSGRINGCCRFSLCQYRCTLQRDRRLSVVEIPTQVGNLIGVGTVTIVLVVPFLCDENITGHGGILDVDSLVSGGCGRHRHAFNCCCCRGGQCCTGF